VARTSVVFGPHRNNFVLWVLRSLRAGTSIRAVRDQWVSPTASADLAHQVLALAESGATGIYHTAGAERLSRLEMAHRIARHFGLDASPIESITMADLNWVAPRPRDSSLDVAKVSKVCAPLRFDDALATLEVAA
jgi:dTDP-4-dehydrorhamnose reductase